MGSRRIACLGPGEGSPGEPLYDAMHQVGELLAKKGATVLTGGYGGAGMEAPARGARSHSASTIGYTYRPGARPNEFIEFEVRCHELMSQNLDKKVSEARFDPKVLAYNIRMAGLLSADGFVFAGGGGIGTFFELIGVLNARKKFPHHSGRHIAILNARFGRGWSRDLLTQLASWTNIDDALFDSIRITASPEDAVDCVMS